MWITLLREIYIDDDCYNLTNVSIEKKDITILVAIVFNYYIIIGDVRFKIYKYY